VTDIIRIPVHPSRLAWGISADGQTRKDGDITRSYSADRIAEGKPIREPFEWQMSLCVCVSISGAGLNISGQHEFRAYRLIPAQSYNGVTTTYREKTAIQDGDFARSDPYGFYNAMRVSCGQHQFVMSGPEIIFFSNGEPDRPEDAVQEPQQMGLFS
jgi:hypothetical protein